VKLDYCLRLTQFFAMLSRAVTTLLLPMLVVKQQATKVTI